MVLIYKPQISFLNITKVAPWKPRNNNLHSAVGMSWWFHSGNQNKRSWPSGTDKAPCAIFPWKPALCFIPGSPLGVDILFSSTLKFATEVSAEHLWLPGWETLGIMHPTFTQVATGMYELTAQGIWWVLSFCMALYLVLTHFQLLAGYKNQQCLELRKQLSKDHLFLRPPAKLVSASFTAPVSIGEYTFSVNTWPNDLQLGIRYILMYKQDHHFMYFGKTLNPSNSHYGCDFA